MSVCEVRAFDEVLEAVSSWDIGATGAHTKTASVPGTLFSSVTRTAAGKYTVNFTNGVPKGPFLGLEVEIHRAVDAAPLLPRQSVSTYTSETAATPATVKYETWNVANAPVQTELASGDTVKIRARWLKTK